MNRRMLMLTAALGACPFWSHAAEIHSKDYTTESPGKCPGTWRDDFGRPAAPGTGRCFRPPEGAERQSIVLGEYWWPKGAETWQPLPRGQAEFDPGDSIIVKDARARFVWNGQGGTSGAAIEYMLMPFPNGEFPLGGGVRAPIEQNCTAGIVARRNPPVGLQGVLGDATCSEGWAASLLIPDDATRGGDISAEIAYLFSKQVDLRGAGGPHDVIIQRESLARVSSRDRTSLFGKRCDPSKDRAVQEGGVELSCMQIDPARYTEGGFKWQDARNLPVCDTGLPCDTRVTFADGRPQWRCYPGVGWRPVTDPPPSYNLCDNVPPADLAPPSALRAAVEGGAVRLNWTASPTRRVTGYRIERRLESGRMEQAVFRSVDGRPTTTYADSDVQAGLRYYYRVRAHAGGQLSAHSGEVAVLIATATTIPPENISVTRRLPGSLDLARGDGLISGWAAEPGQTAGLWVLITVDGTSVTARDKFLVMANSDRPDVDLKTGLGRYHGFEVQLPARLLDEGRHEIHAYAREAERPSGQWAAVWFELSGSPKTARLRGAAGLNAEEACPADWDPRFEKEGDYCIRISTPGGEKPEWSVYRGQPPCAAGDEAEYPDKSGLPDKTARCVAPNRWKFDSEVAADKPCGEDWFCNPKPGLTCVEVGGDWRLYEKQPACAQVGTVARFPKSCNFIVEGARQTSAYCDPNGEPAWLFDTEWKKRPQDGEPCDGEGERAKCWSGNLLCVHVEGKEGFQWFDSGPGKTKQPDCGVKGQTATFAAACDFEFDGVKQSTAKCDPRGTPVWRFATDWEKMYATTADASPPGDPPGAGGDGDTTDDTTRPNIPPVNDPTVINDPAPKAGDSCDAGKGPCTGTLVCLKVDRLTDGGWSLPYRLRSPDPALWEGVEHGDQLTFSGACGFPESVAYIDGDASWVYASVWNARQKNPGGAGGDPTTGAGGSGGGGAEYCDPDGECLNGDKTKICLGSGDDPTLWIRRGPVDLIKGEQPDCAEGELVSYGEACRKEFNLQPGVGAKCVGKRRWELVPAGGK